MHLSKVSGQDDGDPGEKKAVEKGNSTSGRFIVRNVSLNHLRKVKGRSALGRCRCYQERVDQCSSVADAWVHTGTCSTASSRNREDLEEEFVRNYGVGRGHGGKASVSYEGMCSAR